MSVGPKTISHETPSFISEVTYYVVGHKEKYANFAFFSEVTVSISPVDEIILTRKITENTWYFQQIIV